jgi:hypothetical protein
MHIWAVITGMPAGCSVIMRVSQSPGLRAGKSINCAVAASGTSPTTAKQTAQYNDFIVAPDLTP